VRPSGFTLLSMDVRDEAVTLLDPNGLGCLPAPYMGVSAGAACRREALRRAKSKPAWIEQALDVLARWT